MSGMEEIEHKLLKVKEARHVEHTLELCKHGVINNASIFYIKAEDAAESERSLEIKFTPEESALIFQTAEQVLKDRYARLTAELTA